MHTYVSLDCKSIAARLLNQAHAIIAQLDVPDGGASGVLVAHGSGEGGYALFVQDSHLHYVHNYLGVVEMHLASTTSLPTGRVQVRFEYEPLETAAFGISRGAPGRARLYFDDHQVGEALFPVTLPFALAIGGDVNVGRDGGRGVSQRYEPPFGFTGAIAALSYGFEDEEISAIDATAGLEVQLMV
ncbi:MAG TPA: hypothetical protein VH559_12160 [Gemmatimonadaceae bacterium]|jgi:arylsulfatase